MTLERGLNEVFAAALQRYRERAGMSQSELGRRMSDEGYPWHQMTVARTEDGERPVRLDEAVALADILHVGLRALYRPAAPPTGSEEFANLLARATSAEEHVRGARTAFADAQATAVRLKEDAVRARERADEAAQEYEEAVQAMHQAEIRAERAAELLQTTESALIATRRSLTQARARYHMEALNSVEVEDQGPEVKVRLRLPSGEPPPTPRERMADYIQTRAKELRIDPHEVLKPVIERGIPRTRMWRRLADDTLLWEPGSAEAITKGGEPTPIKFTVDRLVNDQFRIRISYHGIVSEHREEYNSRDEAIKQIPRLLREIDARVSRAKRQEREVR